MFYITFYSMYMGFARVAGIKYHKLSSFINRNLFSHNIGVCKFQMKVPTRSDSQEGSLPGGPTATFFLVFLKGLESYQDPNPHDLM